MAHSPRPRRPAQSTRTAQERKRDTQKTPFWLKLFGIAFSGIVIVAFAPWPHDDENEILGAIQAQRHLSTQEIVDLNLDYLRGLMRDHPREEVALGISCKENALIVSARAVLRTHRPIEDATVDGTDWIDICVDIEYERTIRLRISDHRSRTQLCVQCEHGDSDQDGVAKKRSEETEVFEHRVLSKNKGNMY